MGGGVRFKSQKATRKGRKWATRGAGSKPLLFQRRMRAAVAVLAVAKAELATCASEKLGVGDSRMLCLYHHSLLPRGRQLAGAHLPWVCLLCNLPTAEFSEVNGVAVQVLSPPLSAKPTPRLPRAGEVTAIGPDPRLPLQPFLPSAFAEQPPPLPVSTLSRAEYSMQMPEGFHAFQAVLFALAPSQLSSHHTTEHTPFLLNAVIVLQDEEEFVAGAGSEFEIDQAGPSGLGEEVGVIESVSEGGDDPAGEEHPFDFQRVGFASLPHPFQRTLIAH